MHQFTIEKQFDKKELVETLQAFVTKSNLAEFEGRLELLYAFHCHATYLDRTTESQMLINVLWNLYSYFKQYSGVVANKIRDLRAPIERKLKDYVKIVKWKDISYWSVKETMDKSHKTLHKFMKEFQVMFESFRLKYSSVNYVIYIVGGSFTTSLFLLNQHRQPKCQ